MKKFLGIIFLFLSYPVFAQSNWQGQITAMVDNGGVLAVGENGKPLYMLNIEKTFIPASTLKVATALVALKTLGDQFRFKTDFYLDDNQVLYVKGFGDPFLISEELTKVGAALKNKGLKRVQGMVLDTSFYDPKINISGRSETLNPYDAHVSALVANFNTIFVYKDANGTINSAEIQTPVTEITKQLAKSAPKGKSRISLVDHKEEAVLYVGHLLKEFLLANNIEVTGNIVQGQVPPLAKLFLSYANSRNIKEVLSNALEYSQNLIMNQLFLASGAFIKGAPATINKGKIVMDDYLKNQVGLKNFNIEEGSGLSRANKISPSEMDRVLVAFFPYRNLLPEKHGMLVKTGTLNGVGCLVGYFKSTTHGWVRFSILLNQAQNYRDKIAKLLYENLQ